MLIRITIRSNIIAGAIFKILSRSFYAEILALQGLQAGLRDSYFIRDKSGYPEFRNNQTFSIAGTRKGFGDPRGTLFFELARLAEARKLRICCLKMYPVCYLMTAGGHLRRSLTRWTDWGMLSNGNVLTAKISASPSQETACTLSDILMSDVEEKYFLSPKQQEVLLFKPTAATKENESTPPKD